jgi:hypothetical protein
MTHRRSDTLAAQKLTQWVKKRGTVRDASNACGLNYAQFSGYMHGVTPTLKNAYTIQEVTRCVKMEDWMRSA